MYFVHFVCPDIIRLRTRVHVDLNNFAKYGAYSPESLISDIG
jgi:hypothetical protein